MMLAHPFSGFLKVPQMVGAVSVVCEATRNSNNRPNRHMNPKFRNLRRLKVQTAVPLKYMKNTELSVRDGILQNIPNFRKMWRERDIYISSTNQLVDKFIPPEDRGGAVTEEVKKTWNSIGSFGKDKLTVRKIRSFEPEFNLRIFEEEAKEIYIKAHECLAANDHEKLVDHVTEHARTMMLLNAVKRTVHWKYLKSLEPPKVVQVRAFKVDENDNMFAQVTVRFFSEQLLAVYDRFGRLIYGSEIVAKDVLEYVVFEKHLSNEYGVWRVHDKILPSNRVSVAEQTFAIPREDTQETSAVKE